MKLKNLNPNLSVADLLREHPEAAPVFFQHRMACVGCSMSRFETLSSASKIYQVQLDRFLAEISQAIGSASSD